MIMFAEDTDIAVLLLYHWQTECKEIFLNKEKSEKILNIYQLAKRLGEFKKLLLVIHLVRLQFYSRNIWNW